MFCQSESTPRISSIQIQLSNYKVCTAEAQPINPNCKVCEFRLQSSDYERCSSQQEDVLLLCPEISATKEEIVWACTHVQLTTCWSGSSIHNAVIWERTVNGANLLFCDKAIIIVLVMPDAGRTFWKLDTSTPIKFVNYEKILMVDSIILKMKLRGNSAFLWCRVAGEFYPKLVQLFMFQSIVTKIGLAGQDQSIQLKYWIRRTIIIYSKNLATAWYNEYRNALQ